MHAVAKLAGFAVVLGALLAGGTAMGRAVGPLDVTEDTPHGHAGAEASAADAHGSTSAAAGGPGGLQVAQAGYSLQAERTVLDGVFGVPLRFRITGPDGTPVHDFAVTHEREMHLIVVSRDLATFAHLHPTRAADGTWSVALPALAPGAYRAFADFAVAGGPSLVLGVDLTVPGDARPAPLPPPAPTATLGEYQVGLGGRPVQAGTTSEVPLAVSRAGVPVSDLDPYLGAAGHLVAIRAGDLAYLHVHPKEGESATGGGGSGPVVRFDVEVPSPGDYRLFFDFSHGGVVRTAAFTVHVPPAPAAPVDAGHTDRAGEEHT